MADVPRLLLARAFLERLHELPRRPWEVGGWLLGYWTEDRAAIVVTHGTPPAVRGTAFGIMIRGKGHRRRFDEAWACSNGHVTFIGDWHTHPGGPATPSATDHRAMRQLAADRDYGTPEPLIAIASVPRLDHTRSVEVAFYLRRTDGHVLELKATPFEDLPAEARTVPEWPWPRRRRPRRRRRAEVDGRRLSKFHSASTCWKSAIDTALSLRAKGERTPRGLTLPFRWSQAQPAWSAASACARERSCVLHQGEPH